MEPKFQSSFIPKGPLATTGTATKVSRQSDRSVLGTIAVIVFVLSVVAAAGAFSYEWYLKRDIGNMGEKLKQAKTSLEPEIINKISSLDERINSTWELLDRHIILTPLFVFLENSTLKNVRFNKFSYSNDSEGMKLKLQGQARGYAAVALQSQIFNASPYLEDVIFEDLSLDENGNVIFSLESKLDPSIVSFKGNNEEVPAESTPIETPAESLETPQQ